MAQRDVRRELARVLREWDDTVERRLKAFLADSDDVETIHRFRISIRTLRSLLVFVSPFLKRRRHRLLQDELRSVVVETSRLREYDVLLRQVRARLIGDSLQVEAAHEDLARLRDGKLPEHMIALFCAAGAEHVDPTVRPYRHGSMNG